MKKRMGKCGNFFKYDCPKKMNARKEQKRGLSVAKYGTMFTWRTTEEPEKEGSTIWSTFAKDTKYFEPSKQDFMINYRVENMEQLVEQLKADGVTVVDEIATYDYGKFVHILDPEGNSLELWEE